jgi:hypothetical protein
MRTQDDLDYIRELERDNEALFELIGADEDLSDIKETVYQLYLAMLTQPVNTHKQYLNEFFKETINKRL